MKLLLSFALSLLTLSVSAQIIDSQWKNCRIAVLGDSISDPENGKNNGWRCWWSQMEDILDVKVSSFAVNGHQMIGLVGQAEKMQNEMGNDLDAIFIFCGTNDFNANVPLGDWYDEEYSFTDKNGRDVLLKRRKHVISSTTFRGRINTIMDWLNNNYSDKQIILLTPLHRGYAKFSDNNVQPDEMYSNLLGLFIDDYVEVVKEAGNVWSVPVVDIYSLSGLMPVYDSFVKYFNNEHTDRLHPSDMGHARLAYTISYQLLALPSSFSE